MLRQMRSPRVKTILWIGLAIIVIPSFVVFYGWQDASQRNAMVQATATVDFPSGRKAEVRPTDIQSARRDFIARAADYMGSKGIQPTQQMVQELADSQTLIDHAIDLEILKEFAAEHGITATEEEALQSIENQLPPQARANSQARLQVLQMLQQQGLSLDDLVRQEQFSILLTRTRDALAAQSRITYYEAWLEYQLKNEKIVADVARFPAAEYRDKVEAEATADAAAFQSAVTKFYDENKEKFRIPDQVEYRYLIVRQDDLKTSVTISEDEITSYYASRSNEFRLPRQAKLRQIFIAKPLPPAAGGPADQTTATEDARKRASDIKDRIAKGERFEVLADLYNEPTMPLPQEKDTLTSPSDSSTTETATADAQSTAGGNMGLLSEETVSVYYGNDFTSAVFSLAPGAISPVLETEQGFHVVKADEIRPSVLQELDKVRDTIRERLTDEQLPALFDQEGERLRDLVSAHTSLDSLAEATSMTVATTPRIDKNAAFIPGIGIVGDFREALRDLEKGGRSELLSDAGRHLIIEIKEEFPTNIPPLDEIRARVEASYKESRSRQLAKEAAEALKAAAATAADLTSAGATLNAETTRTEPFTRSEVERTLGNIEDFQEQTRGLAVGEVRVSSIGPEDSASGYVVWGVVDKVAPDQAEFRAALPRLVSELSGRRALSMILENIRDKRAELGAKVQVNEAWR